MAAVITTLIGLGGGIVHGLFTSNATATLSVTVAAPVIPRPGSVTCTSITLPSEARFTWSHPSPAPTGYRIRIQFASGEFVMNPTAAQTSTNITSTTIGLQHYLALVTGETPAVTVNAVYGTYESPSAFTYRLQSVLGSVGCSAAPAGLALTTTTTTTPTTTTTTTTTTLVATPSSTTTPVITPVTATSPPTTPTTSSTTTSSTTTSSTTTSSTTTSSSTTTTTTTTTTTLAAMTATIEPGANP